MRCYQQPRPCPTRACPELPEEDPCSVWQCTRATGFISLAGATLTGRHGLRLPWQVTSPHARSSQTVFACKVRVLRRRRRRRSRRRSRRRNAWRILGRRTSAIKSAPRRPGSIPMASVTKVGARRSARRLAAPHKQAARRLAAPHEHATWERLAQTIWDRQSVGVVVLVF